MKISYKGEEEGYGPPYYIALAQGKDAKPYDDLCDIYPYLDSCVLAIEAGWDVEFVQENFMLFWKGRMPI